MNFFSIKLCQKPKKNNSSSFTEAGFAAFEKLGFCLYFWINRKTKLLQTFEVAGWPGGMAEAGTWAAFPYIAAGGSSCLASAQLWGSGDSGS